MMAKHESRLGEDGSSKFVFLSAIPRDSVGDTSKNRENRTIRVIP